MGFISDSLQNCNVGILWRYVDQNEEREGKKSEENEKNNSVGGYFLSC